MAGDAGRYDWKRPVEPPAAQLWIADHRILVRWILALIDLTLVIAVVASIIGGDTWWVLLLQVFVWAWLTYYGGWLVPNLVDRWRAQSDRPADVG